MLNIPSFARPLLPLLLGCSLGACDLPDDELELDLEVELDDDEPDDVEFRVGGLDTGRRLNTNSAGGHFFDELPLDGSDHEGVTLLSVDYYPAGVDMDTGTGIGASIPLVKSSISVDGSLMYGMLEDGWNVFDTDFEKTVWHITTPSGDYNLVVETGSYPGSSEHLYSFYWTDNDSPETPQPTCLMPGEAQVTTAAIYRDLEVSPDGSITQVPELLNIGCIAGSVGKSAIWGYRPWYDDNNHTYQQEDLERFQASSRMIMADYCGDGISYTAKGTPIYLQDKIGVNDSFAGSSGPQDEAVWSPDGALCLDLPRLHSGFFMWPSCNGVWLPSCSPSAEILLFADPNAHFRTGSDL